MVSNERSQMGWFVKVFGLILFVRGNSLVVKHVHT